MSESRLLVDKAKAPEASASFDDLPKELKLHLFSFFNIATLKIATVVSQEWNELSNISIKPYLIAQLNAAATEDELKAFFEKVLNETQTNVKLVRAILSTPSILDAFINLTRLPNNCIDTQGISCLVQLIKRNPDIAAENLDLLYYRLDNPYKSGLPAVEFWAGTELFTKSIQLALKLLDKQEIIDYLKKDRNKIANRFSVSIEVTPLVAEKIMSNSDLLDLIKDYRFLFNRYEKKWATTNTLIKIEEHFDYDLKTGTASTPKI